MVQPKAIGVPQVEFLALVDEYKTLRGIRSDRSLCIKAGVKVDFIRDLRRRGGRVAFENVMAIDKVLKIGMGKLKASLAKEPASPGAQEYQVEEIEVVGVIQAGLWQDASEWPKSERFTISSPFDRRFYGIPRFALQVRGNSMDKLYPEGSIVLCVRFHDIDVAPKTGDVVVVIRRDSGGSAEATLKQYERDASGRHILWPRSTDPEFQSPIILPAVDLAFPAVNGAALGKAYNYALPEAGMQDLEITGLVVGHFAFV